MKRSNRDRGTISGDAGTFCKARRTNDDRRVSHDYAVAKFCNACARGDERVVRSMLARGMDVDACMYKGFSPLAHACMHEQDGIAGILLEWGADPDARGGKDGLMRPLHHVCYLGNIGLTRALLRAGADPNAVNSQGDTPLRLACYKGRAALVRELLDFGASPFDRALESMADEDSARAIRRRAELQKDGIARFLAFACIGEFVRLDAQSAGYIGGLALGIEGVQFGQPPYAQHHQRETQLPLAQEIPSHESFV